MRTVLSVSGVVSERLMLIFDIFLFKNFLLCLVEFNV